jgi:hypothetical protein
VTSIATTPTLAAAGDIACRAGSITTATTCRHQYTAALLESVDAVLALGDLAYEDGSDWSVYAASWGAAKARTYPVPGNHEYLTPAASGYFSYWGERGGDPGRGYYAFNVGPWRLYALNSNCGAVSCAAGGEQEQWLRADLAAHPAACSLAYWHHPRWSSALGANAEVAPLWQALAAAGADVVVVGHSHNYERFAPVDATGNTAPAGVREFVVGTGGRSLRAFGATAPNSEARIATAFGVLRLTLGTGSYQWQFVAETGAVLDSGSVQCS